MKGKEFTIHFGDTAKHKRHPDIKIPGISDSLIFKKARTAWRYGFLISRNDSPWLEAVDNVFLWRAKRRLLIDGKQTGQWQHQPCWENVLFKLFFENNEYIIQTDKTTNNYYQTKIKYTVLENDSFIGQIDANGEDHDVLGKKVELTGKFSVGERSGNYPAILIPTCFAMGFIYLHVSESINNYLNG